jgi:hypothetical protein
MRSLKVAAGAELCAGARLARGGRGAAQKFWPFPGSTQKLGLPDFAQQQRFEKKTGTNGTKAEETNQHHNPTPTNGTLTTRHHHM